MTGLLLGASLIYSGHDWAGAILGAGGLASVLAAYFKSSTPKEPAPDESKAGDSR